MKRILILVVAMILVGCCSAQGGEKKIDPKRMTQQELKQAIDDMLYRPVTDLVKVFGEPVYHKSLEMGVHVYFYCWDMGDGVGVRAWFYAIEYDKSITPNVIFIRGEGFMRRSKRAKA